MITNFYAFTKLKFENHRIFVLGFKSLKVNLVILN